jgi:hypothetical protein
MRDADGVLPFGSAGTTNPPNLLLVKRCLLAPLAVVAFSVLASACGGGDDASSADDGTVLEQALGSCTEQLAPEVADDPNSSADDVERRESEAVRNIIDVIVRTGDEGETLIIDGRSDSGSTNESQLVEACVYRELDVSDALFTLMGQTSSAMGPQEYDENGLHYRWTYHPDNGLDTIVTLGEDE